MHVLVPGVALTPDIALVPDLTLVAGMITTTTVTRHLVLILVIMRINFS
jgi:hypothetical protein